MSGNPFWDAIDAATLGLTGQGNPEWVINDIEREDMTNAQFLAREVDSIILLIDNRKDCSEVMNIIAIRLNLLATTVAAIGMLLQAAKDWDKKENSTSLFGIPSSGLLN